MLSEQTPNSAHTWEVGEEAQATVTVPWPAPDSLPLWVQTSPGESSAVSPGSPFLQGPGQLCSPSFSLFCHQIPSLPPSVQDKDQLRPGSQPKWPSALRRLLMRGVSRERFERARCPEQFLKRKILTLKSPLNTL